jgi:hypothetical protein
MKVPNVDGNYKTRDGSLVVIVTRSTITVDLVKSKETEYTVVDEDERQPPRRKGGSGESPLRKMGKGFTDLSYMLIGGD